MQIFSSSIRALDTSAVSPIYVDGIIAKFPGYANNSAKNAAFCLFVWYTLRLLACFQVGITTIYAILFIFQGALGRKKIGFREIK